MSRDSMEAEDELRPEYDLSQLLKGGTRGNYAAQYQEGVNLVLLAPDVAAAFASSEAVNAALRLVLQIAQIPVRGQAKPVS
jgi:hypothetical protein